jgi:hypothetical protein
MLAVVAGLLIVSVKLLLQGAIDRRGALLSLAALAASPALMSPQPASAAATPVPGSGVPGASPLPVSADRPGPQKGLLRMRCFHCQTTHLPIIGRRTGQ